MLAVLVLAGAVLEMDSVAVVLAVGTVVAATLSLLVMELVEVMTRAKVLRLAVV